MSQSWSKLAQEWAKSLYMVDLNEKCVWVLQNVNVVDSTKTIPSDDSTNVTKCQIWIKKNNFTKAMITQYIKADLVIKVTHAKHTKESWDTFLPEFSQTRSGLIMLWFRRLTKQLPSGGDVSTHVTSFQEDIYYLVNAEFNIPGYITVAILLSTLPSDPEDLHSWNQHVAGIKIEKKKKKHHHPVFYHKWYTWRKTMTHWGWQDWCTETRVSTSYFWTGST